MTTNTKTDIIQQTDKHYFASLQTAATSSLSVFVRN